MRGGGNLIHEEEKERERKKKKKKINLVHVKLEVRGERHRDDGEVIGVCEDLVHAVSGWQEQDGILSRGAKHPHHVIECLIAANPKEDVLLLDSPVLCDPLLLS